MPATRKGGTTTPTPGTFGGKASPSATSAQDHTPVAYDFKRELYAFWGGGGSRCWYPDGQDPPAISVDLAPWPAPTDLASICLYGFSRGEQVTVEVYNSNGARVGSGLFTVSGKLFILGDGNEVSLVEIPVILPLSLPPGLWEVRAQATSSKAAVTFPVGSGYLRDYSENPFLTIGHIPVAETFNPLDPKSLVPFRPGEQIWVEGRHFSPDQDLPLGLYQGVGQLVYLSSWTVRTGGQGAISQRVALPGNLPSGAYAIIPHPFLTDPDQEIRSDTYGRFTIQAQPVRQVSGYNCEQTISRLTRGERAVLSDQTANNLRSDPSLSFSEVIGKIQPGEHLILLEGPDCNDQLVWWYVYSLDSGLLGWTAEGDDQNAWLSPAP